MAKPIATPDMNAICLPLKRLTFLAAAALLVACGGGSEEPTAKKETEATSTREQAKKVFTPTTAIPADAHIKGMFSAVVNWPLIPIHVSLLPDGRVLSFGTTDTGTQTANFIYDVWDPEGGLTGGHQTIANSTGTDIFCSSLVSLASGTGVFIAGGDNWNGTGTTNTGNNNSNFFNVSNNTLTRSVNMNRARWYSASTTLLNGEVYIQGGAGGQDRPEVRQENGSFRLLSTASTNNLSWDFPRNFIAPDGRVFGYDSAGRMYYVTPSGTGSIALAGQFNSAYSGGDASAAMFRPGRILQFGGSSNGAAVIDIRNGSPVVTATQSMTKQRRLANATVLANGQVVATGGSRSWNAMDDVSYTADIWNPDTGTWTTGATYKQARLYHSTAVLLPDATVLVAGGGAPGPQNNLNAELFFPPYLFNNNGTLAARPNLTAAPTVMDVGRTYAFQVTSTKPVARMVMVRTSSVTHSWNMDQRFVELPFTSNNGAMTVQAPSKAADAPPGMYMVFALDNAGVPSVAKMVRINVAANPNPATVPTLTNPGDRTGVVGSATSLQLQAVDPNGDTLTYSATGLPAGLSINRATGLITGSPTTNGSYNVVVSATDGVNTDSKNLVWSITGLSGTLQVAVAVPSAATSGAVATFTASSTNGVNTRYKWNFGDGTGTAYSTSATATHTYSQAGLYYVSVTAIDARGVEQTDTVMQTVYLPLTSTKPQASTSTLWQQPTTGNARLWVVNPDTNSVTVFDAVTRTKLREIAVGAAPRTLALASNGMVWVANKDSASLSVINAATMALDRTLFLPRGSQPYGVVPSANASMLIVLEGGGRLLKYSATNYAQTGSLAIGLNARHVSVAADGNTAYVSRFISPTVSNEHTTAPGAGGGEVLTINASTMSLVRTMALAQSTADDAENQGRGLPNYLGAAVVSPDGTQAFVPSKLDNIKRGTQRDGQALNFQNTVRAVSSRINLQSNAEDLASRIDHDNASMASAAAFDPRGVFLFVALETSREVAVIDAHARRQIMRLDVGRAPQGVAVSGDGATLYVSNFMDRSVTVFDLRSLRDRGAINVPRLGTLGAVATESLSATVLKGKQLFYDARDTRLARDRYMSCASCHNDGGHDGRVWDLSHAGEGLRNTISLRGRAGAQGHLHWSNNFDEVQDFEGQIRTLAGGTGLMSSTDFNAGTRSQPLGDKKVGLSADLDALAAYVASLNTFAPSPTRPNAGSLSTAASAGKTLFQNLNCGTCHSGTNFTRSAGNNPADIGTLKASTGKRLDGAITGIDVPTLRDVWQTAPYLHDGSAATLEAAVRAHSSVSITDANLANLVAYLKEIGSDEASAPAPVANGSGLRGEYFSNTTLAGTPALTRTEAVNFAWQGGAPAATMGSDNFSVRWTGSVLPSATGAYRLRTLSDDGVRVWVNGNLVIDNWTLHGDTYDVSPVLNLVAGQVADIRVEYFEQGGWATMKLEWQTPGAANYVAIPPSNLLAPSNVGGSGGLKAEYYSTVDLTGAVALTRTEAVNFDWGTNAPAAAVGADNFSVRWSGFLTANAAGAYTFQTYSDDGVRLWVNGVLVIDNWTDHAPTTNNSAAITLAAGQRVSVRMEYYERGGGATAKLGWRVPGSSSFVPVPGSSLSSN